MLNELKFKRIIITIIVIIIVIIINVISHLLRLNAMFQ